MFSNRKAQISSGIVAVATIVLLGTLMFAFFTARGTAQKDATLPFIERDFSVQTANYLNSLLSTKDEFGNPYSKDIELAVASPDLTHQSGQTFGNFMKDTLHKNICDWLSQSLEGSTYQFVIRDKSGALYECGIVPRPEESVVSNVQMLPIN